MNAYFFKMTNEERTNILDQHKEIYDGYVTQYANTNEQPLYVQDLATQPIKQSIFQTINQTRNHSNKQSFKHSINQSINQSNNQSIKQSIN